MNADQNEEQFLIRVHPRSSAANFTFQERHPNTDPQIFELPISLFLPLLFQEAYRGDESRKRR